MLATKKILLAVIFTAFSIVLLGGAQPAYAAIVEKHENFSGDMSGNVGNLNMYWPPYGNLVDKKARVTLKVPTASSGKPVYVQKVVFEMHDHDESIMFFAEGFVNGTKESFTNITPSNHIDTASDKECGRDREPGGGFIKLIHDHHTYPDATNPDKNCYTYHTVEINAPIEELYLRFECATDNCRNSWDEHVHMRNYVWFIEENEEPRPIPDPILQVTSCVVPGATRQLNEILKVTWGEAQTPIQTVAITDSQAGNRWESPAGRFWSKETRGASSISAPADFVARTPTTASPLVFKPNTKYDVVLWDGARLSNPKSVTFEACPQEVKPATASLAGACNVRTNRDPITFNFNITTIDTKGATFKRGILYLDLEYNSSTQALQQYLGTPNWSDWQTNNRSPKNGDKFAYTLNYFYGTTPTGNIPFDWDDRTAIGGMVGNQRTLSQLETWIRGTSGSREVKVSLLIETTANGNTITSPYAASKTIEISPTACVEDPVCTPTCGICSLPGSSDSCGGVCPMGEAWGAPNPVQILIPESGEPLTVTNNNVTISWRQQPTNNQSARYVDNYQVLIYPRAKYTTVAAAIAGFNNKNGDVVFFYQPAIQNNPAAVYVRTVTLPQAILNGGNVTIAVRSLNLTCPNTTDTLGNPNNPQLPPPTPTIPTPPPWTEDPEVPLQAAFAGRFYKSDSCNIAAAEPIALSSTSVVTIIDSTTNQQYSGTAAGNSYSIGVSPATEDYFPKLKFDQSGQSETLACSACNPADVNGYCQRPRTTGPTNTAHFFLESYNLNFDSWWQTRGGLVYGHSGIRSVIPVESVSRDKNTDCADTGEYCEPYLIRKSLDNTNLSAGIPMTGGSFSSIEGWWTDRPDDARAGAGVDAKSRVPLENYAYFMNQLDEPLSPDITGNISRLSDIPGGTLVRNAKVSYRNGNMTFSPNETWNIPAGEKRVIFVNGNLTFSQIPERIIAVQPGGFVAFIVSGDIVFDATVGHSSPSDIVASNSLTPNIEGVFIANGAITVQTAGSDDKKFVGAGSFVGWSGVNLQRTFEKDAFGRVRNNTTPTETFIYRPDFLINVPDLIKTTEMTWKEVN